jgi:hypothetical protein
VTSVYSSLICKLSVRAQAGGAIYGAEVQRGQITHTITLVRRSAIMGASLETRSRAEEVDPSLYANWSSKYWARWRGPYALRVLLSSLTAPCTSSIDLGEDSNENVDREGEI